MTRVEQLEAQLKNLRKSQEAALDITIVEAREMTDSERVEYGRLTGEIASVDENLRAARAKEEWRRTASPVLSARCDGSGLPVDAGRFSAARPGEGFAERLFGPPKPLSGTFASAEDQVRAILRGQFHSPIQATASNEVEGVGGGFSVEEQFAYDQLNAAYASSIVLPRANVEPMTSRTKVTWDFDMSSAASGILFGGLIGQWFPESPEPPDLAIKPSKLVARLLTAHLYAIVAQAGNSLLEDAPLFGSGLTTALGTAIGYGLDGTFFSGSGVGCPQGMLNARSLITVAKESGQIDGTLQYENLTNMFARMHPSCLRTAVWVASPTTIPQLLTLQLGLGVAGQWVPVLQQDSGRFFILGKEVLFSDQLPALGSKGDISLVDFSQYTVGIRKEVTVDVSAHVGFLKNLQTYRAITRADGGSRWTAVYTPKVGSTLSWCVTLAARP